MKRVLAPVLAAHYLAAFAALGMPLFLPEVLAGLAPHAPHWLIGVMYVLPTVCTALAAPAWGRFADRHGRKRSLLRAQLGLAAGFALAGFAPDLRLFVLGLVVQGGCGGSMAAANAYLSTRSQGSALARALDWTQFSARLALVTAPAMLGLLGEVVPAQTLYRYLALLPLLGLALGWRLPADQDEPAEPPRRPHERPVAAQDGFAAVLVVQFLFCFALVATFPYFLPYSTQLGVRDGAVAGLLYGLPHLLYLVAAPWLGALVPMPLRLRPGLALLAVACLAHAFVAGVGGLVTARLLFGAGMLLALSGLNGALGACAGGRRAGRTFGRFDACGKWAGAAAGLAAGALAARFDPSAPFFAAAIAAGLALALAPHRSTSAAREGIHAEVRNP